MNCRQVEHRLSDYLDKSLDSATSGAIESHLSSCDRCRAEAAVILQCIRQIAELSQVEPPIGFAQRVIAHVKEIESKPTFWESLFLPSKFNLPIQATALVLIGVVALYIAEQEPHRKLITSTRQTFAVAAKDNQPVTIPTKNEPARPFIEKTTPADPSFNKKPRDEDDPKPSAPAVIFSGEAGSEQERASHPQQQARATTPRVAPQARLSPRAAPAVAVPQRPVEPEASLAARGTGQSSRKPKVPAIPVVSNPHGLSPAYTAPAPLDLLDMMGVGSLGSTPLPSEFQRLSFPADIELVMRRRPVQSNPSRDHVGAVPKSDGGYVPREQTGRTIDGVLSHLRESTNRQSIWLTLSQNQYDRFKSELLAVGTIESEFRKPASDIASAANAESQLRLMLIVLPAEEDETARPAGIPSR